MQPLSIPPFFSFSLSHDFSPFILSFQHSLIFDAKLSARVQHLVCLLSLPLLFLALSHANTPSRAHTLICTLSLTLLFLPTHLPPPPHPPPFLSLSLPISLSL